MIQLTQQQQQQANTTWESQGEKISVDIYILFYFTTCTTPDSKEKVGNCVNTHSKHTLS